MLKLRKGSRVPFPEKLFEGYKIESDRITSNVNADKLTELCRRFIAEHPEALYFILELPTKEEDEKEAGKLHTDVYYIDNCSKMEALAIIERYADMLVNDGMCSFGFGGHQSHDEITVGKYNVVTGFSSDLARLAHIFELAGVKENQELLTAWKTFTEESPGESTVVEANGLSVYDLPELFLSWGMYFKERREINQL